MCFRLIFYNKYDAVYTCILVEISMDMYIYANIYHGKSIKICINGICFIARCLLTPVSATSGKALQQNIILYADDTHFYFFSHLYTCMHLIGHKMLATNRVWYSDYSISIYMYTLLCVLFGIWLKCYGLHKFTIQICADKWFLE